MTIRRSILVRVLGLTLLLAGAARAAPGDQPVKPLPPQAAASTALSTKSATLPARGLFVGNQLTPRARDQLVNLILEVLGRDVEVALVVPSGRWQIDGSGQDERDLTPARLDAVRNFLAERGVERKRILVESRIDPKATEARLDIQIISRPSND
jgi:OOP family OmpA-OmpF porin